MILGRTQNAGCVGRFSRVETRGLRTSYRHQIAGPNYSLHQTQITRISHWHRSYPGHGTYFLKPPKKKLSDANP